MSKARDLADLPQGDGDLTVDGDLITDGKVGIGTSSPIYDLQVGSYGVDADSALALASTTTGTNTIRFGDGLSGIEANSGQIQYNHANNSMVFWTDATERMRIDSSGNVGIGTSSPNAKLMSETGDNNLSALSLYESTVGGSAKLDFAVRNNSSNPISIAQIRAQMTSGTYGLEAGYLQFYTMNGGASTEAMRINKNGNTLLGTYTDNGVDKLQVNGSINYSATISCTSGSTKTTEQTLVVNNHGGGGVLGSVFGNMPTVGELYVVEIGTNKYLNATFYKANTASGPTVTVLASNGLSVYATNPGGTVAIAGFSASGNVRMMSKIRKIY